MFVINNDKILINIFFFIRQVFLLLQNVYRIKLPFRIRNAYCNDGELDEMFISSKQRSNYNVR